jgi:hypothetical protein
LSTPLQGIVLGGAARRGGPNMTPASRLTHDDGSCAIYSSGALLGVLSEAGGAFLSVLDKRKLAELMRAPLQNYCRSSRAAEEFSFVAHAHSRALRPGSQSQNN